MLKQSTILTHSLIPVKMIFYLKLRYYLKYSSSISFLLGEITIHTGEVLTVTNRDVGEG